MSDDTPDHTPFPSLSSVHAALIVKHCADLTLQISESYVVENVYVAPGVVNDAFEVWTGQDLKDIICNDSLAKLGLVVGDNCASETSEGLWHEMNFKSARTRSIPLNVKFFRRVVKGTDAHLLCARDLRPMSRAQKRFQRELTDYARRTTPRDAEND